jgi:DNA-binding transcriptional LysR family regulator
MSTYPKAQIKFIFDSPSRLKSLLEDDRIDLSISVFPHNKSKSIESKKLYQEELVLIGRADLISHQPSKEDLLATPIIDYYSTHVLFKRWWFQQFSHHLKGLQVAVYASTSEMVYELVKRRLGVGVVPKYVLENAPKDERIHIIQPTDRRLFDYVWLSQFKQKHRNPNHGEFLSLLHRRFKA